MKYLYIMILCLSLASCGSKSSGYKETYVITPQGEKYVVGMKSDGHVKVKKGEWDVEIDNRGGKGFWSDFLTLVMLKATNEAEK